MTHDRGIGGTGLSATPTTRMRHKHDARRSEAKEDVPVLCRNPMILIRATFALSVAVALVVLWDVLVSI